MKYILLLSLSLLLCARENPFAPAGVINEKDIRATNVQDNLKDFNKKEITLSNDARILKYIILAYQSIDGSIKEKKIPVDEKIDWHDSLILATKDVFTPPQPTLEEAPNIQTPEIPSRMEIKKEIVEIDDKDTSSILSEISHNEKQNEVAKQFKAEMGIDFDVEKNRLIIHTKDKLIRSFQISNPHKIALDFKKHSSFYTKKIPIDKAPFVSLTLGAHKDFYRASFLLDGPYAFTVLQKEGRIIVDLK